MSDSTNFQQQQNRAQRRLLFEGFNLQDTNGGVKFVPTRHPKTNLRHSPDLIADRIYTSTPEKKSELNNDEQSSTRFIISENSTHIPQTQQSCIIQLQNAKNLLQSMSRSNINSYEQQQQQTSSNNDNSNNIDNQLRNNGEYIKGDYDFHDGSSLSQRGGQILMIDNPELSYYKSALESERARRSHSEKLIESQRLKLLEYEEHLLQIKSSDMKKTLCMQQLEQMIPNIVDEWKQKELEYQKQLQQQDQRLKKVEHEKDQQFQECQLLHTKLKDKSEQTQQMIKDREKWKSEGEQKQKDLIHIQQKLQEQETTNQQLKFEYEQNQLRSSKLEDELKCDISKLEHTVEEKEQELEEKRVEFQNIQKESDRVIMEHQTKIKQIELELDEQQRDNNVMKMELELRDAKYRTQTESLKIQLTRDYEVKLKTKLDEVTMKHSRLEDEFSELNRRKLLDQQDKHTQEVFQLKASYEVKIEDLLKKIEQLQIELEQMHTSTVSERQELAKKLQDVFETTLLKGTATNLISETLSNMSERTMPIDSQHRNRLIQMESDQSTHRADSDNYSLHTQTVMTQQQQNSNLSTIRSLSNRIDSLADQTNKVYTGTYGNIDHQQEYRPQFTGVERHEWALDTNDREFNPIQLQQQPPLLLPSSDHSHLVQSQFNRLSPIQYTFDWFPHSSSIQSQNQNNTNDNDNNTVHSPLVDSSTLTKQSYSQPQSQSSSSIFSLESNGNNNNLPSSLTSRLIHQQSLSNNSLMSDRSQCDYHHQIQQFVPTLSSISKGSIDLEQPTINNNNNSNESLQRYIKMLLDKSPKHEQSADLSMRMPNSNSHLLSGTHCSLQDNRLSVDEFNSKISLSSHNQSERDIQTIVDDLIHEEYTPRQQQSQRTPIKNDDIGVKKRLDYNQKSESHNDLFDRLSQPKTRSNRSNKTKKIKSTLQQTNASLNSIKTSAWK